MNNSSIAPQTAGVRNVEQRLRALETTVANMRDLIKALSPKPGFHEQVRETATRVRDVVWTDSGRTQKRYETVTEYDPATAGNEASVVETVYGADGRPLMVFQYIDFTHGTGVTGVAKSFMCRQV